MAVVMKYVYKFLFILMIIMLLTMVLSISINVFGRYFGKAFMWIDELSRLTFVWMSFTAIIIGFRDNLHPAFNLLIESINNETIKKLLVSLINILIIFFLIYTLKGGIDYISKAYIQKTAIMGISVAWKYSAIPFASFIMLIETLTKLFTTWKNQN